jgi:hypothetical protein
MKPNRNPVRSRPLWLSALILLVGASLACFVLSLITTISLSNLYFLTGVLFLIVATVPIFTEVGGNARTGLQARREGKRIREALQAQQASGRYSQGTRTTFLFGVSGFICFILAVATL